MHFLALCFIISPFELCRHQYSADMTAKSPQLNLTTSYQINTTNCGRETQCITHVQAHTDTNTVFTSDLNLTLFTLISWPSLTKPWTNLIICIMRTGRGMASETSYLWDLWENSEMLPKSKSTTETGNKWANHAVTLTHERFTTLLVFWWQMHLSAHYCSEGVATF